MVSENGDRDDGYRAIGRWFVEFSRLIFHMRSQIEQRLAKGENDLSVGIVVMRPAGPGAISESFFGLCDLLADLDEDESRVAEWLKAKVKKTISTRNSFAHGDWWVGFGAEKDGLPSSPSLTKTKRGTAQWTGTDFPVPQLDRMSQELHEMRQFVAEFGEICLEPERTLLIWGRPVRVRDIFVRDEGVARSGPLAKERTIEFS